VASRTSEVTREVEQLVGLNASQFRQVILLPQGKFAEVLRARAEERETLLKTLFNTVVFERAGHWLEEKARSARVAQLECARAQEVLRQQAGQEWAPYRSEGEEEGPPADQAALDLLERRIQAITTETEKALRVATKELEQAQRVKQETDRLLDRWRRRATATSRLAELEGKAEVVEAYRQRWKRAEQAEALRPAMEAERSAREALARWQERLQGELRQAVRAREGVQALPAEVVLLDLAQEPAPEVLQGASQALAGRRAEVGALVRTAKEAAEARARAQESAREGQALARSLAEGQQAMDQQQRERLAVIEACTRARTARDQVDGLQRAAEDARKRAQAAAAIGPAEAAEREALTAQNQADAALNRAREALLHLRQRQIDGMAAQLAMGLKEGSPCPVCGATSHPTPRQGEGATIGDEQIAAAERQVNLATKKAQEKAAGMAAARESLRGLQEKAGAAAADPEAAGRMATEALAALKSAQGLAEQVQGLERAIVVQEQAMEQAREQGQASRTRLALLQSSAKEAGERAAALQQELARELGEGIDPMKVLEGFQPLERALKELANACLARSQADTRHGEAAKALGQALAGSPFSSAEEVEEALQGADAAKRQLWAERIEAYEKEVIGLKGALASEDLQGLPEEAPGREAVDGALAVADAHRVRALERLSEARGTLQDIARLAEQHRQGEETAQALREQAELVVGVADRCQGKAAPYISLQRWVLSAYLDDICRYANQRLELMTSSRYQLRLSDEGGRGGRQAGLGLRVLDAYTGEEREVNSLSGGETFQASLALALAVADVVEARTGGLHLEALFIDEGFGTLDPDNLQLAMDELDRLRDGGRMIGIISHVGALKERIRAGIEVSAGETGSTARVVRTVME
jgi:exonuclease SbcC